MWKYIASFGLLFVSLSAFAQQDTTAEQSTVRKIRPDYKPSALRGGIDLYGLGNSLATNGIQRYEVQADVDFHRMFLVGEYGIQSSKIDEPEFNYESNGSFWRVGVDWDLMPYHPENSTIYMGLRYARARFNESLTYQFTDSIWGDVDLSRSFDKRSSRWFEVVTGMKVRVWQGFFIGYLIRYKIFRELNNVPSFDSYRVPGYGLGRKNTNLSFGFYLHYRFAFRYKPVRVKPEK